METLLGWWGGTAAHGNKVVAFVKVVCEHRRKDMLRKHVDRWEKSPGWPVSRIGQSGREEKLPPEGGHCQ